MIQIARPEQNKPALSVQNRADRHPKLLYSAMHPFLVATCNLRSPHTLVSSTLMLPDSALPKMRANSQLKSFSHILLLLLLLLPQYVQGIEVAPGSGCAALCVDVVGVETNLSDPMASRTRPFDVFCKDSQ